MTKIIVRDVEAFYWERLARALREAEKRIDQRKRSVPVSAEKRVKGKAQ